MKALFVCPFLAVPLLFATAASADPIDDLSHGTSIQVVVASVQYDQQPYNALNHVIAKPADTLNMAVAARDLGLDSDVVVHFTGTRGANGVAWSFNETFPGGVSVDWSTSVSSVDGQLVAYVSRPGGANTAGCETGNCLYNVALTPAPGSIVNIHGSTFGVGWTRQATVLTFEALAGLPEARLSGLHLNLPSHPLCVSTATRSFTADVTLSGVADSDGAWVDLSSSNTPAVWIADQRVAPFASSAHTRFSIAANFIGTATLTAAAGSNIATAQVTVSPASACQTVNYVLSTFLQCPSCFLPSHRNSPGDMIGSQGGVGVFVSRTGVVTSLAPLMGADSAFATQLNDSAQLVGTLVSKGASYGFMLDGVGAGALMTNLGDAMPIGLSDLGIAFGQRASTTKAFLFNGKQIVDLPVQAKSTAVAGNSSAYVAGSLNQGAASRGFIASLGGVKDVGDLGGGVTQLQAINEDGIAVGSSINSSGVSLAVSYDRNSGQLKPIAGLSTKTPSAAVAINANGWVAGTSYASPSDTTGQGFLYIPAAGVISLQGLVDPKSGIQVFGVISLNDNGDILANAQIQGKAGVVLFSAK